MDSKEIIRKKYLIKRKKNFINIENNVVFNKKPGYDYSNLDNNGLIKENTLLDDKKVLIGKATNNDSKYILHLLDSNSNIIREFKNVNSLSTYIFDYIRPGKYTFRLIEDLNSNDLWDTGNYLKQVQPEPVYYFPSELDVRANWDLNETFNLNLLNSLKDSIN